MEFRMHIQRLLAGLSGLTPVAKINRLKWYCPTPICVWQAHTLMTEESETIEWINGMRPSDVLWDIGANVGVYSIYAASRGIRAVAFEPGAENYAVLVRNVQLNRLNHLIRTYPIALTRKTETTTLLMSDARPGYALHTCSHQYGSEALSQKTIGYSIDDFVDEFQVPFPTAIKCDVDGNEKAILDGAKRALADTRLKSVMIELAGVEVGVCRELLHAAGLKFKERRHSTMFDGEKYAAYWNYCFER